MIRIVKLIATAFFALAAASAIGAAFLPNSCGIEGVYFNRSVGAGGGVFAISDGLCWVPDVLVGAAAAFAICGASLVAVVWRLSRRVAS